MMARSVSDKATSKQTVLMKVSISNADADAATWSQRSRRDAGLRKFQIEIQLGERNWRQETAREHEGVEVHIQIVRKNVRRISLRGVKRNFRCYVPVGTGCTEDHFVRSAVYAFFENRQRTKTMRPIGPLGLKVQRCRRSLTTS